MFLETIHLRDIVQREDVECKKKVAKDCPPGKQLSCLVGLK